MDMTVVRSFSSVEDLDGFLNENPWINQSGFKKICERFNFPDCAITVVIENCYIDPTYRDIYYHYWATFHFDWPRYCWRIFLFQNIHSETEFFSQASSDNLSDDFLGAIVVRPAYSDDNDHTFGRTLLSPSKMVVKDASGNLYHPYQNIVTAEYKFHLFGNVYHIDAFPFSSQDGVVMKCAETAICNIFDYASASSALYSRVLPSELQDRLKRRLPERVLPSHGLFLGDISFLLKEFGYSPLIYGKAKGTEYTKGMLSLREMPVLDDVSCDQDSISRSQDKDEPFIDHRTTFKDWFRYYVGSSIPVIAITASNDENPRHAAVVIGYGQMRKPIEICQGYNLGKLFCIDVSEIYDGFVLQDDNQIPYCEEQMDAFTHTQRNKLEAYIVPLERHVFLDAPAAVSVFDSFFAQDSELIKEHLDDVIVELNGMVIAEENCESKKEMNSLISALTESDSNPIVINYFLTNSAEYKRHRFSNGNTNAEKKFYASIPMPKSVWIAEISTFELYQEGLAFAEAVLDATASTLSGKNSLILWRVTNAGVFRLPSEQYAVIEKKMAEKMCEENLSSLFPLFHNGK